MCHLAWLSEPATVTAGACVQGPDVTLQAEKCTDSTTLGLMQELHCHLKQSCMCVCVCLHQ